jgi:hypothetical protein
MIDIPRIRKVAPLSIVFVLLLAACSSSIPQDLQTIEAATQDPTMISPTATAAPVAIPPSATAESQPTPPMVTATAPVPTPVVGPPRCLETLERRLVNEQRPGGERYTLSFEEFDAYLNLMGIDSLCIPEQFEEPFLNVDWNDFGDPQIAIGRMVSIGFDGLYPGSLGWGSGYIVFSTYDFEVGSEYVVFSNEEDRDRVTDQSMPNPITVGGADGFTRFQKGLNYGNQPIYKVHIFPFESHYIAFVVNIGHYDLDDVDDVIRQMEIGAHPDLLHNNVRLMDYLASSLQFSGVDS